MRVKRGKVGRITSTGTTGLYRHKGTLHVKGRTLHGSTLCCRKCISMTSCVSQVVYQTCSIVERGGREIKKKIK